MKKIVYIKLLFTLIAIGIQTNLFAQWTELNSGTTEKLNSIAYVSYDYIIYVVGDNGTILRTGDQGETWLPLNSGTTNDLYSIYFSDGKVGFITGSGGLTLYTYDGGASWLQDTIVGDLNLLKIESANNELYAIGNKTGNNLFCKRNNGAFGWNCDSLFNNPSIYDINSLHFIDKDTGYIVGEPEAVFKTMDAGSTWQDLSNILTNTIVNDAYFFDDQNGFIVGSSGLYHTDDGANSWNMDSISLNRNLRSIDFYDNQYGATVGYGTILMTNNGGTTWDIDTTTITNESLYDVLFYDSSLVFIVGSNGLILKNDTITGIIEKSRGINYTIELYPNPFHYSTTLLLDSRLNIKNLTFEIYNTLGQKVKEIKQITNRQIVIKRGKLSQGLYIYLLKNNVQAIGRGKIIIE
ncbi:MAG: T9SS type A sorting domain-containing protein [Bacteroidia bacterium]|nr:T9SS type A sorting domain-containing protein [Bacteroidia bacterium]